MSAQEIQPVVLTRDDLRMIRFVQHYEPVLDMRTDSEITRQCAMGCGRVLAIDVAVCVRCRNASRHPAFGRE